MNISPAIVAVASAPGAGVRGIVRISGGDVVSLCRRLGLLWEEAPSLRTPRRYVTTLSLFDPPVAVPLALHLWPTQRSFTGEPLAELHLPGSPPVLDAVLERCFEAGARAAEPGEFTLRAFRSGRIDLAQAEAVLGVIDASDEAELATALGQLGGGLSSRIDSVREQLLLHLADLEAGLDFVEEDIEFVSRPELQRRLQESVELVDELLIQARSRLQSTGVRQVVLCGLPNAGKSTLLNALTGAEAALVSDAAGTTRDAVSAWLQWRGMKIEVIDTAGVAEDAGLLNAAMRAQRERMIEAAHVIVWCCPADATEDLLALDQELRRGVAVGGPPVVRVWTKSDLGGPVVQQRREERDAAELFVSARTGAGLNALRDALVAALSTSSSGAEIIGATAARCRASLQHAESAARAARQLVMDGAGDELIAFELRRVLDHLGEITGRIYTDDILDRIFSRFCIGK